MRNVEKLDQICIEAEMAEISTTEGYLLNFIQVSDTTNELLIEGDEYLLEVKKLKSPVLYKR